MKKAVIGIDIGGTKIAAHVSDMEFNSYLERRILLPEEARPVALRGIEADSPDYEEALMRGRDVMLATLISLCHDLIAEAKEATLDVRAIGIGTTGQVDSDKGMVVDANPNIVGWTGAHITEVIGGVLDLPVLLENDVRVMALAEVTVGAARDYQHVLCLAFGTGIGGAIVLNNELWRGANFSAGEAGFIRVREGETLETLYSGVGIARQYNAIHGTDYTLRDMATLATEGDVSCIEAIENAARESGHYLAPLICVLDPGAVVVGGGVPEIGGLWWQPFTEAIASFSLKSVREMPILKAESGNRAGMIGAGILAMKAVNTGG